jgi:hypothetical protein
MKKWAHDLNMQFSKEEVQMANKYMKKFSTFPAIKEIQIKTILRLHLTSVRMPIFQNTNNNKCWKGCGETGTLIYCWWECKLVQPLWKAVWRFLKKNENRPTREPSDITPGIYLKECKSGYNRETLALVYCSTVHNSQAMGTAQMPYN